MCGPARATVRRGSAAVASWGEDRGFTVNDKDAWVAEGWVDLGGAPDSPGSLQRARGDFALFALSEGGVALDTGRAGGYRPVYVVWPSREIVVACTRLSPLLDVLAQETALDIEYLAASLLSHGPLLPESTPYAGIRRVPMGEAWVVGPGARPRRSSTVAALSDPELPDDGDLAIRLRSAIRDAIRRSARNAERLAVGASGGLDSSILLSLLVSLARAGEVSAPPAAFTYESVTPPWHDDRPYLRSLERHIDVLAHRIVPADVAAHVDRFMVVDAMPAPSTMLGAAKCIGAFACAQGVDVVLVGEGGDQVLDGNLRLFGEIARRGEIFRGLGGALQTRGGDAFYQSHFERLARFFFKPLFEPLLPRSGLRAVQRYRQRPPRWVGPAFARHADVLAVPEERPATLGDSPDERYARLLRWPALGRWSLMRLQEELVGGYTLRAPLLDDDFLRFAATLPPLSLMQGGFLRGLMREAMRGLVPEGLRLRETKGTSYFFTEQTLAIAGGLDVLADLADVRMLADLGLVEPRPFREFFDAFKGDPSYGTTYADLWRVLSVEAFLRQHAVVSQARAA